MKCGGYFQCQRLSMIKMWRLLATAAQRENAYAHCVVCCGQWKNGISEGWQRGGGKHKKKLRDGFWHTKSEKWPASKRGLCGRQLPGHGWGAYAETRPWPLRIKKGKKGRVEKKEEAPRLEGAVCVTPWQTTSQSLDLWIWASDWHLEVYGHKISYKTTRCPVCSHVDIVFKI